MDDRHAWWAWAVKNSVVVSCQTALAIHFDKWWISLFASLFVSSLKLNYPAQNNQSIKN